MKKSIEVYDRLHQTARDKALTIEEANAKGCCFHQNEATKAAFDDFRSCYREFCEEQNAVEGEPFALETPSIRPFLDQHKATKKANRRLKIGVVGTATAPPVMNIPLRAPRNADRPLKKAEPLLTKVMETKEVVEAKKQAEAPAVLPATQSFRDYIERSTKPLFRGAFFFLPKDEKGMRTNAEAFVKRHGFHDKTKVIEQIRAWRTAMQRGEVAVANEITIVSLDGQRRQVGSIAFSFKSFDACCAKAYTEATPFVQLLSDQLK
tara:strand:- start:9267 stop:10058 length:792 start_codon:yes stop_codon:yes gene_type:complete